MHFNKLAKHYIDLATTPISLSDFAGSDVRYSVEFEKLESELGKSAVLHETAAIDWQKVVEGSETLLSSQSKDLRVTVWLSWALYQRESHAGLQAGLAMLHALCSNHWEALHPRKPRTRAAAMAWLLPRLEQALAVQVPVGEQLPLFRALASHLRLLDECLSAHLGEDAPLLLPLSRRLDELLERASQGHPDNGPVGAAIAQVKQVATQIINPTGVVESSKDAHRNLRNLQDQARPLCTWWLKQRAGDQRALRLSRTLLWLPIEGLPERNAERITTLRGLPADKLTGYHERFKQGLYADLLLDLETSIARAPFWLDGQRLAWECLLELNDQQAMLEVEIQLALFLQRLPGLEELRFHDGAPFADSETRAWIDTHVRTHLQAPAPEPSHSPAESGALPAWEEALQQAQARIRTDGLKVAVQHLKQGLNCAQGGRERFFWQLTMARLCYQAKKYELAKTQLESLDQMLQASGLGTWEPDLALEVLHLLHSCCELLPQNHAVRESKDEIYRRLCHLDLEVVLD